MTLLSNNNQHVQTRSTLKATDLATFHESVMVSSEKYPYKVTWLLKWAVDMEILQFKGFYKALIFCYQNSIALFDRINNCIGEDNVANFTQFLFYSMIMSLFTVALCIAYWFDWLPSCSVCDQSDVSLVVSVVLLCHINYMKHRSLPLHQEARQCQSDFVQICYFKWGEMQLPWLPLIFSHFLFHINIKIFSPHKKW